MVQEALPPEIDDQIGALPGKGDAVHPADGGLFARFGVAEGLEIQFSHQMGGGGLHGGYIQHFGAGPAVPAAEHIGHIALVDAVAVPFALGVEPGMEPGLGFGQSHYAHIPGQVAVEIVHDLPRRQGMLQGKGCHLCHGVNPGIGAARAADLHLSPVQFLQDGFQLFLDGVGGVALLLPAVIFGALVLEGHAVILFHRRLPAFFLSLYPIFQKCAILFWR